MKFFAPGKFLLLLFLPLKTLGQDSLLVPPETYPTVDSSGVVNESTANPPRLADEQIFREIDERKWKQASENLDYSQDVPPEKKKEKPKTDLPKTPEWNVDWKFWGIIFQAFAILLLVAAIGYGIYFFSKQPRNTQVASDGTLIDFDNVEAYLIESDLDKLLKQALLEGQFAMAIRLHYLQIIKQLSVKNHIVWSKEKTNRDYLTEMRGHRFYAEFRETTAAFERVWYGNENISSPMYYELEPAFRRLQSSI